MSALALLGGVLQLLQTLHILHILSIVLPASEGADLFTVLLHEFGHALSLTHSSSRQSLMRPYCQGPAGDSLHHMLGPQDLEQITQLYGRQIFLLPVHN